MSQPIEIREPGLQVRRIARRTTIGLALIVNAVLLVHAWHGLLAPSPPDWQGIVDAAMRVARGLDPFVDQTFGYRWSPLAAYLLVPFAAAGLFAWQVLHVSALTALPGRLVLLCLGWVPFSIVASVWAYRRQRLGLACLLA